MQDILQINLSSYTIFYLGLNTRRHTIIIPKILLRFKVFLNSMYNYIIIRCNTTWDRFICVFVKVKMSMSIIGWQKTTLVNKKKHFEVHCKLWKTLTTMSQPKLWQRKYKRVYVLVLINTFLYQIYYFKSNWKLHNFI